MASKKKSASGNGSSTTPKPAAAARANIPFYDFGKTIEDAIKRFDGPAAHEKVVMACFLAGARAQWADHLRKMEAARGHLLSEAEIDEARSLWRPTVKRRGDHPLAKASKIAAKLSVEEKAALLLALQDAKK